MTENKVKRYYSDYDDMNGNSAMTQSKNGHYVLFSDYELLKAKFDRALDRLLNAADEGDDFSQSLYEELLEGDK